LLLTIDLGNAPDWVSAVGTVSAFLFAVFLYARNLKDASMAQARLLAPVGGVAPVQALPGELVKSPSAGSVGMFSLISEGYLVVSREVCWATVRLVSTSEETFSGIRVWLIMPDGREVDFRLGFSEMAPHEEKIQTCYFWPGEISGNMKVKLQFQDADGRWWERVNGEPVRRLHQVPKSQ